MPNYIWLAPEDFTVVTGATGPTAVGTDVEIRRASAWSLPNNVLSIVTTTLIMPSDWNGGAVTVVVHWSRTGGAGATAVDWQCSPAQISEGDQVDKPAMTPLTNSATVPGAEALARTNMGSFTPAAYRTLRFAVQRGASDSFAGIAWLLGVELSYIPP